MKGRGAHPLRAVEEGVPEGVPGESGEVGRGQSRQGPGGHGEGFAPGPQSRGAIEGV